MTTIMSTSTSSLRRSLARFRAWNKFRPTFPRPLNTALPAAPRSSRGSFKAKVEPLIQIQMSPGSSKVVELPKPVDFQPRKTKVPLRVGEQRLIIATCEKGTVEDLADMKDIKADIDKIKEANPNFVDIAARDVFRQLKVDVVADAVPSTKGLFISKSVKERAAAMQKRQDYRIGIPRLLNTYTYAPLFNAYFASLGLKSENIVYSDYTTPELYRAGASRGRHRSLLSIEDRDSARL